MWSGVAFIASTTAGPRRRGAIGSLVGHVLMGVRRNMELSGVMVAPTIEGSDKVNTWVAPKDGTAEDGGGVQSMCMRRVL